MTIAIHELISWGLTLVAFALFIFERRRNDKTPLFMVLQGVLRSLGEKSLFYWTISNAEEKKKRDVVPVNEHVLLAALWRLPRPDFHRLVNCTFQGAPNRPIVESGGSDDIIGEPQKE